MKNKIFIACHKKVDVPSDELYLPVFVGSKGKEDIGFQRDDEGENISHLNPYYCELTGLYWCWKNLDCDYLGLVHYRRYFSFKNEKAKDESEALNKVLKNKEFESLIKDYKIFVPKKRNYYIETIYNHYVHTFEAEQLEIVREIIENKYHKYLNIYDQFMNQKKAYMFNMAIMPKNLFDDYCAWVFDILNDLFQKRGTENMTNFEQRYPGRISELLFNVWLLEKIENKEIDEKEIKELPYLYIGKIDWPRKIKSFLAAKFLGKKYDRSF